jgi:adenylate cyclase class 2
MNGPNIEVEVKAPVNDLDAVGRTLRGMGALKLNSETQYDEYYDHPCKSYQATDEAVRIRRRIPAHTTKAAKTEPRPIIEMTYKGPRVDPKSKSRTEISLPVTDSESARLFLEHLGFRHVGTITKRRVFYEVGDATVSLDDVEGVGLFIEIEKIVTSRSEVEKARDGLLVLMNELGLDPSTSIRDSYLEMFLRKRPPSH